ncbi:MAG: HDOD domain-containing protein [Colwellia sp.]|nr:HDOD domain-containing protein [Colwellia sp.]
MKNTYIARQAILNANMETIGYELLFRDSPENKFPEIDQDVASSKLIIQNHIYGDIKALSMGKIAFINFTENSLIHKYPLMFDKDAIVIELMGHEKPTKNLLKIINYYHKKGYKIALSEYDLAKHWDTFFPYIDIVKVNIEKINTKRLVSTLPRMKPHNIKLSAERVETKNQKQTLAEIGFSYFQGYFYHQPEMVTEKKLTSQKAHMLQLLSETFNTPINYDKVANIISHDVNLTIGLLKMVNNVASGTQVEIKSLKQATVYLGDEKLCQFIAILALSNLTSDIADEICKQALITGKMMAELSHSNSFEEVSEFAFITGLLSEIEVMLGMPMSTIIKTMPLAAQIEQALLKKEGPLGELLKLTSAYISGSGDDIDKLIANHALNKKIIQQEFVSASQWCNDLGI